MNNCRRKWLALVMVLGGATLLQTATACQTLAYNSLVGLTTSITNVFIQNAVLNAFGFGTLGSSLGSSLTSGMTSSLTGVNVNTTNLTGLTSGT